VSADPGSFRVRIDLAYDGTDFAGWARQPGQRTVQATVEAALAIVLRQDTTPSITVAGRTDAGVHARGQVAHLDVPVGSPVPSVRWLNSVLAPDVRVRATVPAPDGFDARFSALSRSYSYRIEDSGFLDPLRRHDTVSWPRVLDVAAMNTAGESLCGEHDFAAYCKKREGATTVRRLIRLSVERRPDGVLAAVVEADAFCHSMVRALMGALVAVGEQRKSTQWPREVLSGLVRDPGVAVMAAHGLCLEQVTYPEPAALAARAELTRRVRTLPSAAEGGPDVSIG
jgi:tRNA pseudouridine38-40 synthase